MIIIKYNFLISYTKLLKEIFFYVDKKLSEKQYDIIEEKRILKTIEEFSGSEIDLIKKENIISKRVRKKRLIRKYRKIISLPFEEIIYFDSIEDHEFLYPDFLKNFLSFIKRRNIKHKIVILLPIVDFKKRLYNLIMRNTPSTFVITKDTKIDEIILIRYKAHLNYLWLNHINIGENIFNFEYVFMMNYFESLIKYHKNKDLELICLRESTILNDPEKILKKFGYLKENKLIIENVINKSEKISKNVDKEKIKLYNIFLRNNQHILSERYLSISELIENHNIEFL